MIDNDAEMCLIGMPIVVSVPLAVAYSVGELSEMLQDPHVVFMYGVLIGMWVAFIAGTWGEISRRFRRAKQGWKIEDGVWARPKTDGDE